jgi:hypothetical protein
MKTIQFTGEGKHVEAMKNFHKNTWNKTNTLQQSETRVYVVDTDNYEFDTSPRTWDDEKFISEAEIQGTVYTLSTFQEAFNYGDINTFTDIIRFINQPI